MSSTIFVSEVPDSGGDAIGIFTAGCDRRLIFSGGADSNPPTEMSEYLIAAEGNDPINGGAEEATGSFHVGGAHFLMGDGAVRFLSENMHMPTYQALSTRANAEIIGDFEGISCAVPKRASKQCDCRAALTVGRRDRNAIASARRALFPSPHPSLFNL
jgi:hypothetical protein